jgi:hypothetical protein
MNQTPFSLLAIALLVASAVASPASTAQSSPSLSPLPAAPEVPGLVLPQSSLCQWTDAGLAQFAPDANGATFVAFGLGSISLMFQAMEGPGPLPACPGRDAHPCQQAPSDKAGYVILRSGVLCYAPTLPASSDPLSLIAAICQVAGLSAAPTCPPPETSPDGPEAGSPDSGEPQSPEAGEPSCFLDGIGDFNLLCLEDPCGDAGCNIDVCDGKAAADCVCDALTNFDSASSQAAVSCLPDPCGGDGCDVGVCEDQALADCVCDALTNFDSVSSRAAATCVPNPCPDGCDVCEGGGTDCLTDPCNATLTNCPTCLQDPKDCDLGPCDGANCVAYLCDTLLGEDGCNVGLPCGGAGQADCVTYLCSLLSPSAATQAAAAGCGPDLCESQGGDCVAWTCQAALGNPDCQAPSILPCGGAGQDDCRTWLCNRARQPDNCDPVQMVGPLAGFVLATAIACATASPPPPGAPACPDIIAEVEAIIDDAVATVRSLANDLAQTALECANGSSSPTCDEARQASDGALQLLDELTLGTLGLAQQCADELRGTPDADSPVDCERLGDPGNALQRYVDNVKQTFQDIVDTAQACLDNAAATASCQAPCDATCQGACDLCQPCGDAGCGPPVALDRSPPRPDLPPTLGRSFELTLPDSGTLPTPQGGDVDHDGLPDLLDAVNLPSEAQRWTGGDHITLPQGLGQGGFLLLVEPSHSEAQLVLADTGPDAAESMDSGAALDLIALQHGLELRNALAMVLHEGLTVHTTWVGIDNPVDQPLEWSQSLPADGTWLLVRNDPTRLVSALLGGIQAPVALPAAGHYTVLGLNDYRWEFLDLDAIPSFCFDAAGAHGLLPCTGAAEPEWLRAYSGQAAYALRSLQAGLSAGLVPVATDVVASLPASVDSSQVNVRFPFPSAGALPAGDVRDDRDIDGDGRTVEGNGQLDAVEAYLYVDPDEYQAHAADLFSGANAGWTMRILPVAGGPAALTVRVGDVAGTSGRELVVVQAPAAAGTPAETVCLVRSGNGLAFYNSTAPFRQSGSQPCGHLVAYMARPTGVGELLGRTVHGYVMQPQSETKPLVETRDDDGNNLVDSIQVNVPDPATCGPDTHSCTGYLTVTVPVAEAAAPAAPATPPLLPPPAPQSIGSPQKGNVDVFDPASPVHLLGTESRRLPEGIGTDYLLPVRGQEASEVAIQQWPLTDAAAQPGNRLFHVSGSYINMPGEPNDLTELDFLLEPADGNESAQDFLLNGRLLASYLGLLSDDRPVASTDPTHTDGFTQELVDIDGDSYRDLLVHIPHFSQAPLTVKHAHEDENADLWEVHLTGGPLTGWVSGSMGGVFRLEDGVFQMKKIPSPSGFPEGYMDGYRTLGMSIISDSEFYVVTTSSVNEWCNSGMDTSPFIAHYRNGLWDLTRLPPASFNCDDLHDIWMRSDGGLGYAGGSQGLWMRYQSGQWLALARGTSCGIMDIEFNAGTGYVAVAKADGSSCPGFQGSPVMYWNGGSWSTQSVPGSGEMFDVAPDGTWAVGLQNSVYSRSGSNWIRDSYAPLGHYEGVDRDSGNVVWIAGWQQSRCHTCQVIASKTGTNSWTTWDVNDGPDRMRDLDMYDAGVGAAIGANALVVIAPPARIDIYDTLSPSSGLTSTTFTAADQGSTSSIDGPLTHEWSWGDGTTSEGATASHEYSSLGWKDVTHTVTDSAGNTAQKVQQVLVDAQDLGTVRAGSPITVTGSMPSGAKDASDYYRVTYSGNLWVRAELLTGDASLRLRGSLDTPAEGAGSWPYMGAHERILDGDVSTHVLYVAVDRPEGGGGGSYSLRFSEITPTTLSSKLTPGATPTEVTYLDRVRFSVTWTDAAAPDAAPTLAFGSGTPVSMLLPYGTGTPNYAAGVTYTYEVALSGGASYRPIYKTTQAGVQHIDLGAPVMVTKQSVAYHDFQSDAEGSIPRGFNPTTPAGKCCNYWHVTNSNDAKFPSTVQLGRHGNVAWFAHKGHGDYQSTSSQQVAGALETPAYDLRLATRPVLSFASYYETEDLGSADRMTVLIATKDPNGGSWSQWQDPHAVQGYEGGYKQWRTQIIDLGNYAGKLVKVQFKFEASGVDDDFLGWMIDDVAIGTDYDGDTLPDRTENSRSDLLVTDQLLPVKVPDGGTGKNHVRRLDRPFADAWAIDALVLHPNKSDLTVWVGAEASKEHAGTRVLVYDRGSVSSCSPPAWMQDSLYLGGRPMVVERPDGLQVTVDLRSCGLAQSSFMATNDWFIEVKDTRAGNGVGVIEAVRVASQGRTSLRLADSDHDEVADDTEVRSMLDPLGYDPDHDGALGNVDPSDSAPSWIPAIRMASTDFTSYVDVDFLDLVETLPWVVFKASDAGGDLQVLPATNFGGSQWRVRMPSPQPERLVVEWQDARGNHGTLDLAMGSSSAQHYQPLQADGTFTTTVAPGNPLHWSHSIDVQEALSFISVGAVSAETTVGAYTPVPFDDAVLIGVAALATLGLMWYDYEHTDEAPTATHEPLFGDGYVYTTVQNTCLGTPIQLELGQALENQYVGKGFASRTAMRTALAGVCNPIQGLGPGDRWSLEAAGAIIIAIIAHNAVVDMWKWQLPPIDDVISSTPTLEEMISTEEYAADLLDVTALLDQYWTCQVYCKLGSPATDNVAVLSAGDHTPRIYDEAVITLPTEYMTAMKTTYVTLDKLGKFSKLSVADFTVGATTLQYNADRAEAGLLTATQGVNGLQWYWDDGPTTQTCGQPGTQGLRRCTDPHPSTGLTAWDWLPGGKDKLDEVKVPWKSGSTTYHTDGLTAKGYVYDGQQLPATRTGALVKDLIFEQMEYLGGSTDLSQIDDEARVVYTWARSDPSVGGGGAVITAYFRDRA